MAWLTQQVFTSSVVAYSLNPDDPPGTEAVLWFNGLVFLPVNSFTPLTTTQFVVKPHAVEASLIHWNSGPSECFDYVDTAIHYHNHRVYTAGGIKGSTTTGLPFAFGGVVDYICMFDLRTRNVTLLPHKLPKQLVAAQTFLGKASALPLGTALSPSFLTLVLITSFSRFYTYLCFRVHRGTHGIQCLCFGLGNISGLHHVH